MMADLYGSHFEFGGTSSRTYGLIIANVSTERLIQSSGAVEGKTIFVKSSKRKYLIGDDYSSSPLTFDMEIVTDDDRCIGTSEKRLIEKWLFNHKEYRRLYIDEVDDPHGEMYELVDGITKRLYANCRFVNSEKLEYNGGVVGYKFTVETDSPMLWQDAIIKEYLIENSGASTSTIDVDVDTDICDFVYPKVKITIGNTGGDITITNHSDDSSRLTRFIGLPSNASIIMKGELNFISGQYYEKFYQQNFIRLLDGKNRITVSGDVSSIEFEWSNMRRL